MKLNLLELSIYCFFVSIMIFIIIKGKIAKNKYDEDDRFLSLEKLEVKYPNRPKKELEHYYNHSYMDDDFGF